MKKYKNRIVVYLKKNPENILTTWRVKIHATQTP